MFPRAFFAGRYYAPRYWPQSVGAAPVAATLILGSVSAYADGATMSGGALVTETITGGLLTGETQTGGVG